MNIIMPVHEVTNGRQFGNQANHEIRINTKEEAKRIIKFCEMILKLNYEYPSIVSDNDSNN